MKNMILLVLLMALIPSVVATTSLVITYQTLDSALKPGQESLLILTFTNPATSGYARDIVVSLTPGPYVELQTNSFSLGTVATSSAQQTNINIKASDNAISTISYITVKVTYYEQGTDVKKEQSVNVPVTIRREPILQIDNIKYSLPVMESGNQVNLKFDLQNVGLGSARDVRVSLQSNMTTSLFSVVGSGGDTYLDSLPAKDSKQLNYDILINPNLPIGTYSIPVLVMFSDETRSYTYGIIKYIGLTVSGKFSFLVTLTSQEKVSPGMNGKASIKVVNTGVQNAKFLTVRLTDSQNIQSVYPETIYIGKLESDDYENEDISFYVPLTTMPGKYPLNVDMTYKDIFGQEHTQQSKVEIDVLSPTDIPQQSILSNYGLLIALVVIAVVYFSYKKFTKKK